MPGIASVGADTMTGFLEALRSTARRARDVTRWTLGDLSDAWRSGGTRALADEFREAVQFRLFRHGELAVIESDLSQFDPPSGPTGIDVRPLDLEAEWSRLATIGNRRVCDRLRRAAEAGRMCLVAWRAGQPVGYTWLSSTIALDIEGFPIPLPDDALYGWNLYVVPEERRSGIGSALTNARLRYARDRGYRVGWRAIDVNNLGSVGTVRNTAGEGTRIVGRVRYVRVLGWWVKAVFEPDSSRSSPPG